ncbi:histone H1-gamma, late-like [Asterias rubens]|uniref:histone H1-gamma, late-like n=1 Tax=Asterias rubens TaxID=7604 RepID=UPI0014553DA3|nr:histone H1-gamma, late-like [Asterias rubens]
MTAVVGIQSSIGVQKGVLIQTKGKGASGSFKLDPAKDKAKEQAEKVKERAKAKKEKEQAKKAEMKAKKAEKAAAKKEKAKKTKITKKKTPKKIVKKTPTKKVAAKKTAAKPSKKVAKPSKAAKSPKPKDCPNMSEDLTDIKDRCVRVSPHIFCPPGTATETPITVCLLELGTVT